MKSGFLKNMFAIDREREQTFTPEELELCGRIAKKIVSHGLGVPGILFMETARPLNYVTSQFLAFFEPLVRGLFSWDDYSKFRVILERRGSVEILLAAVERAEAELSKEKSETRAKRGPGALSRIARRFRRGTRK